MALRYDEHKAPFVDFGNRVKLQFDYEEFTDEPSKEKATNELRETPDVMEASIRKLRELIQRKFGIVSRAALVIDLAAGDRNS